MQSSDKGAHFCLSGNRFKRGEQSPPQQLPIKLKESEKNILLWVSTTTTTITTTLSIDYREWEEGWIDHRSKEGNDKQTHRQNDKQTKIRKRKNGKHTWKSLTSWPRRPRLRNQSKCWGDDEDDDPNGFVPGWSHSIHRKRELCSILQTISSGSLYRFSAWMIGRKIKQWKRTQNKNSSTSTCILPLVAESWTVSNFFVSNSKSKSNRAELALCKNKSAASDNWRTACLPPSACINQRYLITNADHCCCCCCQVSICS